MSTKFCPSVDLYISVHPSVRNYFDRTSKIKIYMPMSIDTFACSEIRVNDEICDIIKTTRAPSLSTSFIKWKFILWIIQNTNSQTVCDLRWVWTRQFEELDHQVVEFPVFLNIRKVTVRTVPALLRPPSASFENYKKIRYKVLTPFFRAIRIKKVDTN